jgi:hypothetical protein
MDAPFYDPLDSDLARMRTLANHPSYRTAAPRGMAMGVPGFPLPMA